MAKKLEYQITTDSSQGIQGVNKYAAAVKKAMKDVEGSTEDTTTQAQKLAKAYSALADTIESELKGAAQAADALGKALGPDIAKRTDLPAVVTQLNKLGLSFDEITADADQLGASLRKLDSVTFSEPAQHLEQMRNATDGARRGVEEVGKSANSSKSALANMIGNSAQDMGQFAGVTGSAGVAIGQMAEYMADAKLEGEGLGKVLTSFAKIAGPVAALALGTQLVNDAIASQHKSTQAAKDDVEAWTNAMSDSDDATKKYVENLRQAGEVTVTLGNASLASTGALGQLTAAGGLAGSTFAGAGQLLGLFGKKVTDLTPDLAKAGISANRWAQLVSEGADLEDLHQAMVRAGVDAGVQKRVLEGLGSAQQNYNTAVGASAELTKVFGDETAVTAENLVDVLNAIRKTNDPLGQYTDGWNQLFTALRSGDKTLAARLANQLAQLLHIAGGGKAVIGLAIDQMRSDSEAAGKRLSDTLDEIISNTIDQANELRDSFIKITDAEAELADFGSVFNNMERASKGMQSAFDLKNAPLEFLDQVTDIHDGMRDLAEFINSKDGLKGKIPNIFNPNDIHAGPFLNKIQSLRGSVQKEITAAFASGGAPAATETANNFVDQLSTVLRGKISKGDLRALLGLDDLDATIKVALDQKSKAEFEQEMAILTGLKGETPFTAAVKLAVVQGTLSADAAKVLTEQQLSAEIPSVVKAPTDQSSRAAAAEAQAFFDKNKGLLSADTVIKVPSAVNNPLNAKDVHDQAQTDIGLLPPLKFPSVIGPPKGMFDQGGRVGAYGGIAGERRPEIINERYLLTGPAWVPPGTRVTGGARTARILRTRGTRGLKRYDSGGTVAVPPPNMTVNVNGANGMNRFELMRVMRRANQDLVRMLGHRG